MQRKKTTASQNSSRVSPLAEILRTGIPGYDPFATAHASWLDESAACHAIDFFEECLRHIEGAVAGQLFLLQPWQKAIVGNLFGWKRKNEQGQTVRRYREFLIYVPRKNGKTPLAAGICNYALFCDGEAGAQIYSAAAEKEQAALLYRHAKGMIEQEPELAKRSRVYRALKAIELKDDPGSVYKVLSADAETKHGGNPHLILVDELHAQRNRELVDVLQTSMASANRLQPMIGYITTADFARESICNEKHDYACKVRDGVINDEMFLPVIYEAAIDDDWHDPAVWSKVNPNLNVSVSREYLERECKKAQERPAYENSFRRLHLNTITQQDVRWLSIELWDACRDEFDEESLRGRECFAGLDLSTKIDVTAFVLVFPPTDDDPKWRVLPRFFIPSSNAQKRERKDRVPYLTWARQDHITMTDGNVVDYNTVEQSIMADASKFTIREIAFDPWNAQATAQRLTEQGATMIEFGQIYRNMNEPAKELEKLILEKSIAHSGNSCLKWMVSNVSIEQDPSGSIKPSKKKSTERIDGVVAMVMALGRAIVREDGNSVYDSRGLITL